MIVFSREDGPPALPMPVPKNEPSAPVKSLLTKRSQPLLTHGAVFSALLLVLWKSKQGRDQGAALTKGCITPGEVLVSSVSSAKVRERTE